MLGSDKGTAADWLQRGRDPEYIAGVLGVSVRAVLRCRKMQPKCCPTPDEIAQAAAEVRAIRTAADGMRADTAAAV
jgi:hypothetical protein